MLKFFDQLPDNYLLKYCGPIVSADLGEIKMSNRIGRRGNQLRPAELAALMQRINIATSGQAGPKKSSFLDKQVPSISNLSAFRQYGEALLRTNSTDRDLVKTRIREWLGLAGAVRFNDSAINALFSRLQRLVDERLTGGIRNWSR